MAGRTIPKKAIVERLAKVSTIDWARMAAESSVKHKQLNGGAHNLNGNTRGGKGETGKG